MQSGDGTGSEHPIFSAKVVLFDIDNTVVLTRPGLQENVFEEVLCRQASLARGCASPGRGGLDAEDDPAASIQDRLRYLGVDLDSYLAALCDAMRPWIEPFDDAVRTIPTLHERGYLLYPATTNGRVACLAKFTLAGLAQGQGSPFFCDLFGGDEVHHSGKTTPDFYVELLRRIGLAPNEVVMVGDDPHHDLALAHAAGIRQVVLPRRDQVAPIVCEPDGGIYVSSLESLLAMLPTLKTSQPCEG